MPSGRNFIELYESESESESEPTTVCGTPSTRSSSAGGAGATRQMGTLGFSVQHLNVSKLIEMVVPYRSIPNVSIAVERLRPRHRDALVAAVPGQRIIIIEREMVFY